jgi:hypothetical protein
MGNINPPTPRNEENAISKNECWNKYAALLKTNRGNENKAVRYYLVWLMEDERTKDNFNKIFTTDENRKKHIEGLNGKEWLTDDHLNAFAASLGFSLTYVLTHNSHIPPYVSPENYAGFSVANNAPNAVVINSDDTHWRPLEHNVLGNGNCGAYTLASIARRFSCRLEPPKVQQNIIVDRTVAKWTIPTSPIDNPKPGLTLEQREKIYIEKCEENYKKLDRKAESHAEVMESLLLTKTAEELIQILSKAKIAAGDKKTNSRDNNAQWLNGGAAKQALQDNDQTKLIHVLTIEAKNTFHDPDNTFFRQLLEPAMGESNTTSSLSVTPKPLQQKLIEDHLPPHSPIQYLAG